MKCKKCGTDLENTAMFCPNCGTSTEEENCNNQVEKDLVSILNANEDNHLINDKNQSISDNNQKDKKLSKKKKILFSFLGIILLILIIGFFASRPKEIHMETKELSNIISNEEAKKYAGDTIYLHGFLYRTVDNEKSPYLYMLTPNPITPDKLMGSNNEELYDDSNNMVIFVMEEDRKQLDIKLGTGSELILKGQMGETSSGLTVLIVEDIEVKQKVEPIHSIDLTTLNDSGSDYIGKNVMVMGRMIYLFGEGHYLTDYDVENVVKLSNLTEDEFSSYYKNGSGVYVTGILKQENEEYVIEIDNVSQNEALKGLYTDDLPTVSDCYDSSIENGTFITIHGIYKRDVTGSVSHAIVDEDTLQFIILSSDNIDLDKYFENGKDCTISGEIYETGRGYMLKVQAIG